MPTTLLRLLAALLVFALPARAFQAADEITTLTQKLYAAVGAQKWDDAISTLMRLDQLQPETQSNAYNLACMHSRKAEVDKAAEWMDKAVQWGWGGGKGTIYGAANANVLSQADMAVADADLENLRKDPRFETLKERMLALQKKVEAYTAGPALYVPESLKDAPEVGLLVALHDLGGTKDATLAAWKPLADELGLALAVPAAPVALREDLAKGMSWIDNLQQFLTPSRTGEYQKCIHSSVDALRKTRKLAAGRVFLVGEGQGATLALVTGLQNSGLYKGVAALDAEVVPALVGARAQTAKAAGLRLELRYDQRAWEKRVGGDPKTALAANTQPVEGWALPGSVSVVPGVADAAARAKLLADAVRALAAAASATPASAPK